LNAVYEGDLAQVTVTYFGEDSITPADPGAAIIRYMVGSGTPDTLTYTGATEPAVGVYAKTGTGVYVAQFDTTGQPGIWTVQGRAPQGSPGQAVSRPLQFQVEPSI
jgi:hypothetical protein